MAEAFGLSQPAHAEQIGIDPSRLSRLERVSK